jgi:carbonic anhydrase
VAEFTRPTAEIDLRPGGSARLNVIRVARQHRGAVGVGSVGSSQPNTPFGTRLVVVLGHSQCSAVTATLDELQRPSSTQSPAASRVDRGSPAPPFEGCWAEREGATIARR